MRKREIKLRADIKRFVNRLDKLECLPTPSNGDCWYCMMTEVDSGKGLGEVTRNTEHFRSHISEGYLHGSLIMRALKWAGYQEPAFIFALENQDRQQKRQLHNGGNVKRALKRYLYRQLGLVS